MGFIKTLYESRCFPPCVRPVFHVHTHSRQPVGCVTRFLRVDVTSVHVLAAWGVKVRRRNIGFYKCLSVLSSSEIGGNLHQLQSSTITRLQRQHRCATNLFAVSKPIAHMLGLMARVSASTGQIKGITTTSRWEKSLSNTVRNASSARRSSKNRGNSYLP